MQISQNKKSREEDIKRYRPTRISAWCEDGRDIADYPTDNGFAWVMVMLRNKSESPVYDIVVTCVGISGAGSASRGEDSNSDYPCRVCIQTLPPGLWSTWLSTEGCGMHTYTALEIAFTDANGTSWVRRGNGEYYTLNGKLEEIKLDPSEFYKLSLPIEWGRYKRVS